MSNHNYNWYSRGPAQKDDNTMQQLDGVPNATAGATRRTGYGDELSATRPGAVRVEVPEGLLVVQMDPILYNGERTVPATEVDPSGLTAKDKGAKLDANKPPMYQGITNYFPRALKAVAMVSAGGAAKYSWNGWETVPDGVNRYNNAMERHQVDRVIQGEYDPEGFLHRAQIAWNALASLELWLREQEKHGA